jgi:hypothetical protein
MPKEIRNPQCGIRPRARAAAGSVSGFRAAFKLQIPVFGISQSV